ncbi:hypothetical protein SAMN04488238_102351 [Roseicitreum antarcticum]|uniref:Uncharacterized protein n=1 Tax=Roseicitreum antarcticum TaxID=564137 RepID=A0A1H2UDN0_9RHOB|nr:hypothetical protein SAMN04488238_102351 [Roseicitreum antarcticum]
MVWRERQGAHHLRHLAEAERAAPASPRRLAPQCLRRATASNHQPQGRDWARHAQCRQPRRRRVQGSAAKGRATYWRDYRRGHLPLLSRPASVPPALPIPTSPAPARPGMSACCLVASRDSVPGSAAPRPRPARHRSEQYRTSSQTFSHFLRQLNGKPQVAQVFCGNSDFRIWRGMGGSGAYLAACAGVARQMADIAQRAGYQPVITCRD